MSQAWIDNALDELEARLERLFSMCDRFLEGDSGAELVPLQKDVARRLTRLQSDMRVEGVGDAASGDRLRAVAQRFENLQRYWGRLSERMKSSPRPSPHPSLVPASEAAFREALGGAGTLKPPAVPTPPLGTPSVHVSSNAPPPSSARPSSVTPERVQQIQMELAVLNPENGRVSIERLTRLLQDTEASLRARHGNREIIFKVVMKGSRPVIKPIVR